MFDLILIIFVLFFIIVLASALQQYGLEMLSAAGIFLPRGSFQIVSGPYKPGNLFVFGTRSPPALGNMFLSRSLVILI
jgi:hypothetical protein